MPEYRHLTDDALLHLGEQKDQLTQEARVQLEGELSRRKLSPSDIGSYRELREATEKADELKRAAPLYVHHGGVGKRFFGKANRQRDPNGTFELYDATLWFVIFWFPVFPIATFKVRRDLERWLGFLGPEMRLRSSVIHGIGNRFYSHG